MNAEGHLHHRPGIVAATRRKHSPPVQQQRLSTKLTVTSPLVVQRRMAPGRLQVAQMLFPPAPRQSQDGSRESVDGWTSPPSTSPPELCNRPESMTRYRSNLGGPLTKEPYIGEHLSYWRKPESRPTGELDDSERTGLLDSGFRRSDGIFANHNYAEQHAES